MHKISGAKNIALYKNVQILPKARQQTRVYKCVQSVYQGMPWCTRVFTRVYQSLYQGVLEECAQGYARVYQRVHRGRLPGLPAFVPKFAPVLIPLCLRAPRHHNNTTRPPPLDSGSCQPIITPKQHHNDTPITLFWLDQQCQHLSSCYHPHR